MYIAFKWLLGLCLAMWLATCYIDFVKNNDETHSTGVHMNFIKKRYNSKRNFKVIRSDTKSTNNLQQHYAILHVAMFTAGALAVFLTSRRTEIILFIKNNLAKLDIHQIQQKFIIKQQSKNYLYKTAEKINVAICNMLYKMRAIMKTFILKIISESYEKIYKCKQDTMSLILLEKLKEVESQSQRMKQLLFIALQENKNLRNRCQLEDMAKQRLQRYVEEIQKLIKENRTRYFSYQFHYLTTRQENSFLNIRVKQLSKEKVEAERKLMKLVNKVYESKNSALLAYCTDFIAPTKETSCKRSSYRIDPKGQTHKLVTSTSGMTTRSCSTMEFDNPKKNIFCKMLNDDNIKINSCPPKLKGLPGEFVWSVQDKDGFIQKIYEYGYSYNFKNRDTMRRIREYSVYYDKDSLLDYKSTETITRQRLPMTMTNQDCKKCPLARQKFLTGSEAFQRFLHDNTNIVSKPDVNTPPMLCR